MIYHEPVTLAKLRIFW